MIEASSRQDISGGNVADFDSLDHNRNVLAAREDFARPISVVSRIGIDFDLLIEQIDDPVYWDATIGIWHVFSSLVAFKRRVSDFDH
jgi:hypothetical protein